MKTTMTPFTPPLPAFRHRLSGACSSVAAPVVQRLRRRPWAATILLLSLLTAAVTSEAATIWTGAPITFVKADNADPTSPSSQDRLTPNVWLTRDTLRGLFNIAKEMFYSDNSPVDTEWAFGTTAALADLKFMPWFDWHGGMPLSTLGQDAVLHIISDDIYLDIRFTSWSTMAGGGFAYRRSTASAGGPVTADVIEYHHSAFDHYFITRNPDEITKLDNGTFVGWTRTGLSFKVYPLPTAGASSVCRFFSTAFDPKSSHFYTPFAAECASVKTLGTWQFEGEGNEVFYIAVAAANGTCAAGTTPVYRLYNNGQGGAPNHRFTTGSTVRDQMIAAGWVLEGNGPGLASMCAPA